LIPPYGLSGLLLDELIQFNIRRFLFSILIVILNFTFGMRRDIGRRCLSRLLH